MKNPIHLHQNREQFTRTLTIFFLFYCVFKLGFNKRKNIILNRRKC